MFNRWKGFNVITLLLNCCRYLGSNHSKQVVTGAFFVLFFFFLNLPRQHPSPRIFLDIFHKLIFRLLFHFPWNFDLVTYLLNLKTDSEFVGVVMHLRVLIRGEFFGVGISAPALRMTVLCVCVRFRIISSVCILSQDGRWGVKKGYYRAVLM